MNRKKILALIMQCMLIALLIIMVRPDNAYAYSYDGDDYSEVFDPGDYYDMYPDLQEAYGYNPDALWNHFINWGIDEGRQAKWSFDVNAYKNRYSDLSAAYGDDYRAYYHHYINIGRQEGRVGGSIDYNYVFDADYYINNNPDIKATFGDDKAAAQWHYVNYGVYESRQASNYFDINAYMNNNPDVTQEYGYDSHLCTLHYIYYGINENRTLTDSNSKYMVDDDFYNAMKPVFDAQYYANTYQDVREQLGTDEKTLLWHYINYGVYEGRRPSSWYDNDYYINNNYDLIQAYKSDVRKYVMHYAFTGYYEGRKCSDDKTPDIDIKPSLTAGAKGIDVSKYQGDIDWDAVAQSGEVSFAIIRVGFGDDDTTQDDEKAIENMNECERVGIPYGVYLFSYAVSEAEAHSEASHLLRMLQGRNPKMGVYIDIEATDYYIRHGLDPYSEDGRARIVTYAKIVMDTVAANGYEPGIYANVNYFRNILFEYDFSEYKWIAGYGDFYDEAVKKDAIIWQYTSSGSVTGIAGNVDMNILLKDIYF